MLSYRLPKETKKIMERELRQYYDNRKKLDKLKNAIGLNVDNSSRCLIYLEERLFYVENVYKRLKPFEKEVYNLIFKEQCDYMYCQQVKNISKITYYNIYNKSIYYLAEEWGEI